MKRIALISACILLGLGSFAQQEYQLSHYQFNPMLINAATAAVNADASATLLHRSQWVNFEGAPQTSLLAVDGPLMENKMGLGLLVGYEKIGAQSTTDIYGNYAYHLKTSSGKLSFGLKFGATSYRETLSDLEAWDHGDPFLQAGTQQYTRLKFGFGTHYKTDKWFAGISIPTIFASKQTGVFNLAGQDGSGLHRHYYANAGYLVELSDDLTLLPSVLVRYLPAAPVSADITAKLGYKDIGWLGFSFRTGDAIVALLQYNVKETLAIGYAYDYTLSPIRNYSAGSHELCLRYYLITNEKEGSRSFY